MTEFITRFTAQQKWFIDGMTNQFSGFIDGEPQNLTKEHLFHIISYCMERFCESELLIEINKRWSETPYEPEIFNDLYDELFEQDEDFFVSLSEHP